MKSLPVAKLGSLTSLISSGSTPLGGATRYLSEGPVMFIRSQNVRMNCLDLSDVVYIDSALHEEMKRTHVRSGDVFINITGASIGRVAAFDRNGDKANVNQHVCIIRPKSEMLDFRYLTTFLCSPRFQEIINRLQRGGTRQALTFDMIANFDIPLPSLPEQRRIAAILDKADAIRRKREEGIRLTEELLRSTFLEMFGDPVANTKGWPILLLEQISSDMTYGTSTKCGEETDSSLPVLRIPNIIHGRINWSDLKYASLDGREVDQLLLKPGDLLFVRTNGNPEYIGRCAMFTETRQALFASYLIRVQLRSDSDYRPEFLRYVATMPSYRSLLVAEARTTAGNYNISTQGLRRLKLIAPPLALQDKFLKFASEGSAVHEKRQAACAESESLFGSLVQRAFRGDL